MEVFQVSFRVQNGNSRMSKRQIYYFDNNATTRVAPEVVEAMFSLPPEHFISTTHVDAANDVRDDRRRGVEAVIGRSSDRIRPPSL